MHYKLKPFIFFFTFCLLLVILSFTACTKKSDKPVLWIYTSLYNHVIQDLDRKIQTKFPDITVKWYQSGSENVAAKVNSEILAGKPQADLILTSDPFWYEELKVAAKLLVYDSPATHKISADLKDPEHYFVTVRIPTMVIAYNSEAIPADQAPRSFADLKLPRFKDKIAMANPLESGTTFTSVALLVRKFGWDYFTALSANGILSTGGNSAVLSRLETKERPIGIVLLENVLAAHRKNPKIVAVIPQEGAIMIPSPIGIFASTKNPQIAQKIYDYFFSPEIQEIIVKRGDMHSPLSENSSPEGAPQWSDVLHTSFTWNHQVLKQTFAERNQIKQKFSKLILE